MLASQITGVAILLAWASTQALPADRAAAYPNASLLVEPAELKTLKPGVDCIILDTRPWREHKAAHVPGSVGINLQSWVENFDADRTVAAWSKYLGGLRIDTKTRVIVLGDALPDTARVWWILRYWGVERAQILNGGWRAWVDSGGAISKISLVIRADDSSKVKENSTRLATKEAVLKTLTAGTEQIIDARSKAEYCGEKALAKRGGAIPKAIHLDWTDLVDSKSKRFKSPAELTKLFKGAGVDLDKPVVTYCQSGGRASVMAFAVELMGGKQVRNYYGSWAEWGNATDTPVEKPK